MPKDYKPRATRKQKKTLPGYLWLLSGLAIGLFVALIVYLDKQPESNKNFGSVIQQELEKLKQQPTRKTTTKTDEENSSAEKKEPKFNFYTLLPELEIFIPESERLPPNSATENNNQIKTKTDNQFILQVASFLNKKDAEKSKANLAFLGITAHIQNVTVNKQTWHRVRTGPYANKQQLYKDQKTLKNNDIHAITMKLK